MRMRSQAQKTPPPPAREQEASREKETDKGGVQSSDPVRTPQACSRVSSQSPADLSFPMYSQCDSKQLSDIREDFLK